MAKRLEMPDMGVPAKAGKVVSSKGKYFVQIGATKKELPVGTIMSEADVKKLVGKNVAVATSGKSIVAIAPWTTGPIKKRWILCYLPAPDIFKKINERLRDTLRQSYLEAGVLTPELVQKLEINR